MDMVLCDELLQEIFRRLPPTSSPSISLVSRRWNHLLRSSLTALRLHLPNPPPPTLLPSILPRHTSLSTLTLLFLSPTTATTTSSDQLLVSLASLPPPRNSRRRLEHLRFLLGPITPSSLVAASHFFPFQNLTSLQVSSLRPLSFRWLSSFPSLKDLFLLDCSPPPPNHQSFHQQEDEDEDHDDGFAVASCGELPLENLTLCGIRAGNHGFRWLWQRCSNLQRLQLRGCEGTGDEDHLSPSPSSSVYSFARRLHRLHYLELRTSRSIADRVLLQVADHCRNLHSLLLYDGGSRNGLGQFLRRCNPGVRLLDFRLPLDLDNTHLTLAAQRLKNLAALRLQSCCLVTSEGLRSISVAIGGSMEEVALVNCDVVEKETGLLAFLGQTMRQLRRLDLSHNDMLVDRELHSMLASCRDLVDVRLKGCGRLTDAAVVSMFRCCRLLEVVDVTHCSGITAEGVEFFIRNARGLTRILVDETQVSEAAAAAASRRGIEVCCFNLWSRVA